MAYLKHPTVRQTPVARPLSMPGLAPMEALAPSSDSADLIFEMIDRNGDGVLEMEEIRVYLSDESQGAASNIQDTFHLLDLDGDGKVTKEEFRQKWQLLMSRGNQKLKKEVNLHVVDQTYQSVPHSPDPPAPPIDFGGLFTATPEPSPRTLPKKGLPPTAVKHAEDWQCAG